MKKSIYALFLLIGLALIASSCTNTKSVKTTNVVSEKNAFRIVRSVNEDGKIRMAYVFPVNSEELESLGYTEKQIQTYRFFLTSYVNTLAQANKEKEIEGVVVSGCNNFLDIDGVGFFIDFESLAVQNKFYGASENSNSSNSQSKQQTKGFFIKKLYIKTVFPFSSVKSAGDVKLLCTMAISSWAKDQGLQDQEKAKVLSILDESVFIYDFASTQSALKSEFMYDDAQLHHNVFVKSLDDIKNDNNIVFYVEQPNYPVWYISALVVVVCVMMICYFLLRKRKNRKSKQPNI